LLIIVVSFLEIKTEMLASFQYRLSSSSGLKHIHLQNRISCKDAPKLKKSDQGDKKSAPEIAKVFQ